MRPKFRAWDLHEVGSWGMVYPGPDEKHGVIGILFHGQTPLLFVEDEMGARPIARKIKALEFTGLTDRNGVEIWEGDIVEWVSFLDGQRHRNKVHYENGSFCGGGVWLRSLVWENVEVIGNIYSNPELIK